MKVYILQGIREGQAADILGVYTSLQLLITACGDHQLAMQSAGVNPMVPIYREYQYVEATTEKAAGVYMPNPVDLQ